MSTVIFRKEAPPAPNLGLPAERGQNVFTAVRPRGTPEPAASAEMLARRKLAIKKATRVNTESFTCAPVDKNKTFKLLGRRNEARSQ